MDDLTRLREFLAGQALMVVAVTLEDGTPWVVPVTILRWEGREFEWDSKLDTLHSRALEARPEAAVTIFIPKTDRYTVWFLCPREGKPGKCASGWLWTVSFRCRANMDQRRKPSEAGSGTDVMIRSGWRRFRPPVSQEHITNACDFKEIIYKTYNE